MGERAAIRQDYIMLYSTTATQQCSNSVQGMPTTQVHFTVSNSHMYACIPHQDIAYEKPLV